MTSTEILYGLNDSIPNTLLETLDIKYTAVGKDYLIASMPVNSKVHQPFGIMHGGTSAVLAETVGSAFSFINVVDDGKKSVGMQITSNHLKSIATGIINAKATFIKKGKSIHILNIDITDEQGTLISKSQLMNMIID